MRFVDEVTLQVKAGDGGDGCIAFRREKFIPLGGPSGGDGGRGGDVHLRADGRLTTLFDLRYRRFIRAANGEPGRGKDQYGKGGDDLIVRVPAGTQVYDADSGELLADLLQPEATAKIAEGGRGGRGNIHFTAPHDRAPRRAEAGLPGEEKLLRLELKLLADVGIVGFPNVGKSTFIAAVSRARPKIADYPFTTLTPNLGVVSLGDDRSFVIADIPGIVEGAAEGVGLGLRFLRHVERTRVLLHLISLDAAPGRSPLHDFDVLRQELQHFDAELAKRPMVVALSKADLPEVREAAAEVDAELQRRGVPVHVISSATGEGLQELLLALERLLLQVAPDNRQSP